MAKQLYDYWFVQFDFPDESGKPYKSSGGKMVWNSELNKEIPDKLYTGINLIGKFVVLPEGTEIEKNCRIMSKVDYTDLGRKRHIKSGESIHSSKEGGYFELPL